MSYYLLIETLLFLYLVIIITQTYKHLIEISDTVNLSLN